MQLKALLEHYLSRGAELIELSQLRPYGEKGRASFTAALRLPQGFKITPEQRRLENDVASAMDISISLREGKYLVTAIARDNPATVIEAHAFLESLQGQLDNN